MVIINVITVLRKFVRRFVVVLRVDYRQKASFGKKLFVSGREKSTLAQVMRAWATCCFTQYTQFIVDANACLSITSVVVLSMCVVVVLTGLKVALRFLMLGGQHPDLGSNTDIFGKRSYEAFLTEI